MLRLILNKLEVEIENSDTHGLNSRFFFLPFVLAYSSTSYAEKPLYQYLIGFETNLKDLTPSINNGIRLYAVASFYTSSKSNLYPNWYFGVSPMKNIGLLNGNLQIIPGMGLGKCNLFLDNNHTERSFAMQFQIYILYQIPLRKGPKIGIMSYLSESLGLNNKESAFQNSIYWGVVGCCISF